MNPSTHPAGTLVRHLSGTGHFFRKNTWERNSSSLTPALGVAGFEVGEWFALFTAGHVVQQAAAA
jgi:hypothetical protein